MNFLNGVLRAWVWALGCALALGAAGCANLFVSRYQVLVDAIAAPGAVKPEGMSYRLLSKRSVVTQGQARVEVVKACVDAALTGIGMFEAPANVAPDVFVDVTYGVDTAGQTDPKARETFVQLSGRENPGRAMDRPTGEEIWDVKVALMGVTGRVESAMPILCAVAASYVAMDTRMETKIEVKRNDPRVVAVREVAKQALSTGGAENATAVAPPPK